MPWVEMGDGSMLSSGVSARPFVAGRPAALEPARLRETALALRFFALAVACACGILVQDVVAHPSRFLLGIVAGILLALAQDRLLRRAPRLAGPALLVPHVLL